MAEHYTKSTVAVVVWCDKCREATEHNVMGGKLAGCKKCINRLEYDKLMREKNPWRTRAEDQLELFGGK